ncbi:VOC family protein [Poseidonocella sp. HB161398]|uniref:VOC family protein n=1 Tax=Poseidonocella sp. HB161398 TaxID=2320855 RepID=UPI001108F1B6|nr:VOC family protein [Poseidonocella sp. HB161398]
MSQANFRGIEHVGITVPDHDAAVAFFARAFGTEVLFSLTSKDRAPLPGTELEAKNGLRRGTAIVAVSMLRFGNGANLEIFEIDRPGAAQGGISETGISHFSITVEDIDAASAAFAAAGGELLEGPYALTGQEEAPGNRGRFGLTPWGLLIEFEALPSPVRYDGAPSAPRWLPAPRRETEAAE